MYRIRFHGRGGQGMKTASRLLGKALFLEGCEVQDAPRYGAERRGAPIFAYVRASRQRINERGIIRHPDLIIIADDTLIPIPAAGVLSGATPQTILLIHTAQTAAVWTQRLNLRNPVLILPVSVRTDNRFEFPFAGIRCAGAAAQLLGIVSRSTLKQAVHDEMAALSPEIVDKNLTEALHAYDCMAEHTGVVKPGGTASPDACGKPRWIDLPFDNADISAPVVHAAATSEKMRTGLWRTRRPVIDRSRCKRCSTCSTLCPDGAISMDADGFPQIDYEHCKGCMICMAQCPARAITAVREHESTTENMAAKGDSR